MKKEQIRGYLHAQRQKFKTPDFTWLKSYSYWFVLYVCWIVYKYRKWIYLIIGWWSGWLYRNFMSTNEAMYATMHAGLHLILLESSWKWIIILYTFHIVDVIFSCIVEQITLLTIEKKIICQHIYFWETQYKRKRSHTRAYTHLYERTNAHIHAHTLTPMNARTHTLPLWAPPKEHYFVSAELATQRCISKSASHHTRLEAYRTSSSQAVEMVVINYSLHWNDALVLCV
jgi:hypothetical protein